MYDIYNLITFVSPPINIQRRGHNTNDLATLGNSVKLLFMHRKVQLAITQDKSV